MMQQSNMYIRKDYDIEDMYRVLSYAEIHGYWSTSDLMTKEQAEKLLSSYSEA